MEKGLVSLGYDHATDEIIINDVLRLDKDSWYEIQKYVERKTEWDYELDKLMKTIDKKGENLVNILNSYSDMFHEAGIQNLVLRTYLYQKKFTSIEVDYEDFSRVEKLMNELQEFFFVGYVPSAKDPQNSGQILISRFKYIFEVGVEYMKRCKGISDEFADLFGSLFGHSAREIATYCSKEKLRSLNLTK